ncbi:hypothetical protein ACU686_26705 [Yinghuangia aomiensis]
MVAEASAHRMLDTYGQHLTHIAAKDGAAPRRRRAAPSPKPVSCTSASTPSAPGLAPGPRVDARPRRPDPPGRTYPPNRPGPRHPSARRDHADTQAEAVVLGAVIASPDAAAALSWLSPTTSPVPATPKSGTPSARCATAPTPSTP